MTGGSPSDLAPVWAARWKGPGLQGWRGGSGTQQQGSGLTGLLTDDWTQLRTGASTAGERRVCDVRIGRTWLVLPAQPPSSHFPANDSCFSLRSQLSLTPNLCGLENLPPPLPRSIRVTIGPRTGHSAHSTPWPQRLVQGRPSKAHSGAFSAATE